MDEPFIIVLITTPSMDTSTTIAHRLVIDRMAACVNIIPGVTSVYRWEGSVCEENELLLICKTTQSHYQRLEATVREMHPYQNPEIIALDVSDGAASYFSWIAENLS
jgi:periplasmic divalent cation tolerance protein